MRKLYSLILTVFISATLFSQTPEKMSYQAVIRNNSDQLVINHAIGMRISILQGSSSGTVVYTETQTPTTNANGLVSIEIGGGAGFNAINWASDIYFIKTETDPTGGTTYTITGTSQLLSVPYALHAKTVASYPETDPIVKAINGIVKSNGTTISAATTGTDYLTPTGSATLLTGFPLLNQNTSGSSASFTGSLVGDVSGTQGATVVGNSAVIGKVLTGYTSGAGTVAATDNILQAIQKLNGNDATNAILTGMVTSVGNTTTVVTNANLTGEVTSSGNTTTIANKITMTATAPVSITGSPNVIASGAVAISIAAATPSTAGSMSAADKIKLDGIATPTHIIGESYGGGIIFYLDASGQHGLVAATTDKSTGIQWYNGSNTNTTAFASSVGAGDGNTSMIVYNQGTGTYAAQQCYDSNTGGYYDWYLPSKYELNLMYQNIGQGNLLGLGNVGSFASSHYWSSTENNINDAWTQNFNNGGQYIPYKSDTFYVRAVRAF